MPPTARAHIDAPVDPATTRGTRLAELRSKGSKRTPAEASEAIDLLAAQVADLTARLEQFAAGRP